MPDIRWRTAGRSSTGVPEYRFNAALAVVVLQALRRAGYVASFIVDPFGEEITLRERTARADRARARLFLSLHHESVQPRYLEIWQDLGVQRLFSDPVQRLLGVLLER